MKEAYRIASLLLLTTLLQLSPAAPPIFAQEASREDPAFVFTLAKMLAEEGSFRAALEAYEDALRLSPEDPYVPAEYASFLTRLAQLAQSPRYRQQQLARAEEQAAAALALAPEDPDVLHMVGRTLLLVAEYDPRGSESLGRAQEVFETLRRMNGNDVTARLSLGQIYTYQRRPDLAAEVYEEILNASPTERRVYSLLADALVQTGQGDRAEEFLRKALRLEPDSFRARFTLAELQSRRGEHRGAVATLREGSPDFLGRREVRRFLAFQLYLAGDLAPALELVDALLEEEAEPALGQLRARILTRQGRDDNAVEQLKALARDNPGHTDISLQLARALVRQGAGAEAAGVLRDLVESLEASGEDVSSEVMQARIEWAELHRERGEWAEAVAVAKPLLASEDPRLRLTGALLQADPLLHLERGEEALAALEENLPEEPINLAQRSEVLLRLERAEEAKALVHELAASGNEEAFLPAALAYQRRERYGELIPLLNRFLRERPESREASFMLGAAYERTGRRTEAASTFRSLLEREPDYHQALNYLGYMWAEEGKNLDQALKMVQQAVSMVPDNGSYVDSLGWVYFQMGRYPEALVHLRQAAELIPDDATVNEHLGDVYRALGEQDKAGEFYLRALAQQEDNAEVVRRKLEELSAPVEARP